MKTYPLTVMQSVWRRIKKPRKGSLPLHTEHRNLAENLWPMTDEDVEILWESLGISVEELEEMKEEHQPYATKTR